MPAIGIDFGSVNSRVAVWKNGSIKVIPNDYGNRTTPSCVAFTHKERLIGDAARSQAAMNASNTIYNPKRLLGRYYDDAAVEDDIEYWTCQISPDSDNYPSIGVQYMSKLHVLTPEQICAMILRSLKETAEKYLQEDVNDVVITVPALFNNKQREATKNAAKIAGLNVLRILNDTTAAALAYGVDYQVKGQQFVLIYHLGAGTFDVSIVKIINGTSYKVIAVAGDTSLGGDIFDQQLFEYFKKDFEKKHCQSIDGNVRALYRLRVACESTKKLLSTNTEAMIEIDSLSDGIDYVSTITRCCFEQLCADLFTKTLACVEQTLLGAKLTKFQIDEVILVGGSTRIPKIRSMITEMFSEKQKMNYTNDIDDVVVHGAAIQAATLPKSSDAFLQSIEIFDIIPIALGIVVHPETVQEIVKKWAPLQNGYIKPLKTSVGKHPKSIQILGGTTISADDCTFLKEFRLSNIPTNSQTKCVCIISLDADGIFDLTVKKSKQKITVVETRKRFTEPEIAEMQKEADSYRQNDEKQKQNRATRAKLDDFILNCQHKLTENTVKLTKEQNILISCQCTSNLTFLDNDREAETKELVTRLKQMQKISKPMFQSTESAPKKVKNEIKQKKVIKVTQNEADEEYKQNRAARAELEEYTSKCKQKLAEQSHNKGIKKQEKKIRYQCTTHLNFLANNPEADTKELVNRLQQMQKVCGFMFQTTEEKVCRII